MKVYEIEKILLDFAPSYIAEPWDNVGLLAGFSQENVTGILLCVDATKSVIDEAVTKNCNLIVSHHPIIIRDAKKFNDECGMYSPEVVAYALRKGVNVISLHTNLDKCEGGINDSLAKLFEGTDIQVTYEGDIGRKFTVEKQTLNEFAKKVSKLINDDNVKFIGNPDDIVEDCYVIGGSGADERTLQMVAKEGLTFITGEVKHHIAINAVALQCKIIDVGHFTSERIFVNIIYDLLKKEEHNLCIPVLKAEAEENPFKKIKE